MVPREPKDRFVTQNARQRLDDVFGFSPDAYMQDWEIELSDGQRLQEFVNAYDTLSLDEDERFALMALIVASAHDSLDFHGLTDSEWRVIHDRLVLDANIHASTIFYWCCVDATCDDECFTLTSRMRAVWNDAFDRMEQQMPVMPGSGEPSDAPKDRASRIDNGNSTAGPR